MRIPSGVDPATLVLSNDEIRRYSRHLIMPEVTLTGQQRLKAASVLCIGTGGLGSPVALYLAAAGVGRIGERSSHTWFVLTYLLGYPNVRNYDGSWTEWGNLVGAPIERP